MANPLLRILFERSVEGGFDADPLCEEAASRAASTVSASKDARLTAYAIAKPLDLDRVPTRKAANLGTLDRPRCHQPPPIKIGAAS